MTQKTRAALRGIELPFTTVQGGLEFGAQKVLEYNQKRQEELAEMQQANGVALNAGAMDVANASYATHNIDPSGMDPLDFGSLLEEYESELERNLEQADQSNEQALLKSLDEEQGRVREDDFEIESPDLDLDDDRESSISDSRTKKKNSRGKTNGRTRSSKKSKSKSKKKIIKATKTNVLAKEERKVAKIVTQSQEQNKEAKQLQTKKVITARNTEIVGRNEYTGQNITRQMEKIKDQAVGGGKESHGSDDLSKKSANKPLTVAQKLAEAKLTVQVESLVKGAAMVTHQTGRATEFKIGKDTLKFERQGEDTFALRNGEKIPIDKAQDMLKALGRAMGSSRMEQLVKIVKDTEQNPTKALAHTKQERVAETNKEQQEVKIIKVQSR